MVPTFKMHGSKARSAPWIVSLLPQKFDKWVEPFAGRGNVFFRMAVSCNFHEAHINDINTAGFLIGLRDYSGDYGFVDEGPIDKQLWLKWKDSPDVDSVERTLAESYVARFGSSYKMGPNTAGGDSKNGHSRRNTILRMQAAKSLLSHVNITSLDWEAHLKSLDLSSDDVVYLDPPYDVKQNVHFDNIDHNHFVEVVKTLPCNVFVSGYTSLIYEEAFKDWQRVTRERASVGKGAASKGKTGNKPKVEEIVWFKIAEKQ